MHKVLLLDYKNLEISAEIPGLFKKAGCIVEVFCGQDSWLLKNNSYDVWHLADSDNPDNYFNDLISCVKNNSYAWIVSTEDMSIRIIRDRVPEELFTKLLPLSRIETRSILGSKAGLSILCKKFKITTPKFEIYNHGDDLLAKASRVAYPLLLKVDESGGGRGVFLCKNGQDLKNNFQSIPDADRKDLVLQKYIEGELLGVEALYHQGHLLAYAHSRVLENTEDEFSVSVVREYYANLDIEKDLEYIGQSFGFNGFCSFTFIKKTKTEKYYLIEADLRTHSWFALTRFCGVDFSKSIKNFLNNTENTERQSSTPVTIRHFSRSLRKIFHQKDLGQFIAWAINLNNRWKYIPDDPRILGATLKVMIKNKLKKVGRAH